ncbi:hypothetical protein AbraIFM66950_008764 [Aspergillus brasiliensis]|nr:hypothetical protein AbraIFM66950_008764 [Aspergillus brasiliensis]
MAFAGLNVGNSKDYLKFTDRTAEQQEGLYRYEGISPPAGLARSNVKFLRREVSFEDIRGRENEFSIEEQGFCLSSFSTGMSDEEYGDREKIRDTLYPEVREVLKRLTGASIAHVWSHVVTQRHLRPSKSYHMSDIYKVRGKHADDEGPLDHAHIDNTKSWAAEMFELYCRKPSANIAPWQKYEFYNLWVPLRPVRSFPLALCDQRTVKPEDVIPTKHHKKDRVRQNYLLRYDPAQRWYFKHNQKPSEAWIFYQGGNRFENKLGMPA